MIAPVNPTSSESKQSACRLREAHRVVVSTLLPWRSRPPDDGPAIPAWRARLFAGWVVIVTVVYFASMFGWW